MFSINSLLSVCICVRVCFNIAGGKKGFHGTKGQISQIPGLSPVISTVGDVTKIGKRVGVVDTDSEYVKLAKQGGHKGLLYFDETPTSKPNSFDAADSLLDERKSPRAFSQRPLPPFWTDNMSAWERDDGSPRKEKVNIVKQLVQWQASSQNNGGSKFRRTVSTKNTSPVNMSKLLSFGYVDDDKLTTSETESSAT
uniref:Uncharacterized protein n=1 Tax=Hippocampus comes TaxID=109280 RepID=A0A3Q2YS16_HIPCM